MVDGGEPRNAPATGVQGYLTRDGMNPVALLEAGRAEVRGYGGEIQAGQVVWTERIEDGFAVTLDDGSSVGARRLLVTTGLIDELPDIPGFRERWGRDVLDCPYCHGWEFREQPIGILASGPWAAHQALLFRQWSADVTLLLHTAPRPTDKEAEKLAARGIAVVQGEVASLEIVEDRLAGVRVSDDVGGGEVVSLRALALLPRRVARAALLAGLGLGTTAHPLGEHIAADATGLTAVPGVWVAGNVTDLIAQVIGAADAGVRAAAAINADLIAEDARQAVAAHRNLLSSAAGGGG